MFSLNLFQRCDYTFSHVFRNQNFEPVPSGHLNDTLWHANQAIQQDSSKKLWLSKSLLFILATARGATAGHSLALYPGHQPWPG